MYLDLILWKMCVMLLLGSMGNVYYSRIKPSSMGKYFSFLYQALEFFNMSTPLFTLCATGQFASFFYSPLNPDFDLASLEEAFCAIDIETITIELKATGVL